MTSITITLKENMMLNCYLQTQIAYEIKTEDIYENFYKDKDLLDFSNYPKDSNFFYPSNTKEIGKIKDESKGKIIIEFAGLKLKL